MNKCIISCILTGIVFLAFYYILLDNSFICSSYEFQNTIIPKLCTNPTPEVIILPLIEDGSESTASTFCKYLCSREFDVSCHTHHLSKPFVFTLTESVKDFKFVLKSIKEETDEEVMQREEEKNIINLKQFLPQETYLLNIINVTAYWKLTQPDAVPIIPSVEELQSMISSHIQSFLGKHPDKTLLQINSSLLVSVVSDISLHEDLWKFIYDHEFLTSFLFHNYRLFPKILGTCKSFYAVEFAQPLMQNPLLPLGIPLDIRLKKAIDLLHFIERVESQWEEPIQLCDMKHDHFGWIRDEVLFLDLDNVVTNSALQDIMTNFPTCTSHEDCSFFDCAGECLPNKQCSIRRRNSNLQVLCGKIFLGNSESSIVSLFGLLNVYDISDSLRDVLELCSTNPGMTSEILIDFLRNEYNNVYNHAKDL